MTVAVVTGRYKERGKNDGRARAATRARYTTRTTETLKKLTTTTRRGLTGVRTTPVDLTPRAHAHTQTAD